MTNKLKTKIIPSPYPYGKDIDIFSELSFEQLLALLAEQALVERLSCLQEIKALRTRLELNNIRCDDIENWVIRSDNILDKLLRYKLGKCGKLVKQKKLITPYSWRRKFRKRYKE